MPSVNDVVINVVVDTSFATNALQNFSKELEFFAKDFSSKFVNIGQDIKISPPQIDTSQLSGDVDKVINIYETTVKKASKAMEKIPSSFFDAAFEGFSADPSKVFKNVSLEDWAKEFKADLEQFNLNKVVDDSEVVARQWENLNEYLNIMQLPMEEFKRQLTLQGNALADTGQVFEVFTGKQLNWMNEVKKASMASKRFNFALLSLMFTGMALDRTFGSLIKTQMELYGLTDAMSGAWSVVLQPLMDLLTPIIMSLVELFLDLDPAGQTVIAMIVGLGAILGKVFTFLGMFGMGVKGLTSLFPALGTKIAAAGGVLKLLGGIFTGVSAAALAAIAAIVVVVIGMVVAWKENFMGMKDAVSKWVGGIKDMFNGLLTFFKGLWDIIAGLFMGDTDKIVAGLKGVWNGFITFFKGLWNNMAGFAEMVMIGALRVVVGVIQGIVNLIGRIPELWGGKRMFEFDWISDLSNKGSFRQGGDVPTTGSYLLHAGERVIPASQVRDGVSQKTGDFNPTIIINVNNDVDENELARTVSQELNRQWAYKMGR